MSRISDEELRRLLSDTTPGPWSVFIDDTGGRWTGWPLSIDADTITDKVVVRTGGQWPYEWDAKTSQHEACENARLIALAPALAAEVLQLREALSALHHAVCGETGFAEAVRLNSGLAYPWPALDIADEMARAALSTPSPVVAKEERDA